MSVRYFIIIFFISAFLLRIESTSENKVIRSKNSNFQFDPKNSQSHSHSSRPSQNKSKKFSKNSKSMLYPPEIKSSYSLQEKLHKIASDIKYELVDSIDAVVFAESNEERLDNIIDICHRNRPILGIAALGILAKIGLGQAGAVNAAEKVRKEMLMKEASKWGRRIV